ncbi:helix-turn-helix domain-containing protein [Holdemania massiliensis]|uniref:helix-turn-helix domain-containing protein n=1 Tax=Holdemania massiliensis TaxID=1468449 RepID=UPI003566E258
METIFERFKIARKELGLTQTCLGEQLGSTRSAIAAYERNVVPSDSIIELLKLKFGVRPEFIKNGELPILEDMTEQEELAAWMGTILKPENDGCTKQRIIRILSQLEDDEWKAIEKIAKKIAEEYKKG